MDTVKFATLHECRFPPPYREPNSNAMPWFRAKGRDKNTVGPARLIAKVVEVAVQHHSKAGFAHVS